MLDSKETNNNEKLKILTEEPFMKKTIQNIILNGMVIPKKKLIFSKKGETKNSCSTDSSPSYQL